MVCPACYEKTSVIKEPRCKSCGKHILDPEQEYCYDCHRHTRYFDYGFSLWNYDSTMKKSISDFKYRHRKEYVEFYAQEFTREFGEQIADLQPDALVPIPVHWTRYIQRGYNQAQLLAEAIGSRLEIPVIDNMLIRTKKTVAQKQLDDRQRIHNLEHAFSIAKEWKKCIPNLNRLLLIDDIYTTGSTINACARILKQLGATEVYFGVLCIGIGY